MKKACLSVNCAGLIIAALATFYIGHLGHYCAMVLFIVLLILTFIVSYLYERNRK